MEQAHRVKWIDDKREPQCPPDPAFPTGIDVDCARGAQHSCKVALPYPARRIGLYEVTCKACGAKIAVTTAGRPDDPRSVTVACQRKTASN